MYAESSPLIMTDEPESSMLEDTEPSTSSSSVKTRRDNVSKLLLDVNYKEESEFIPKLKLPKGEHLIGRMIHLCSVKSGKKSLSQTEASKVVAKEVSDDWNSKNVYPLFEKNIANRIKTL